MPPRPRDSARLRQAHSLFARVLMRRTQFSAHLKDVLLEASAEARTALGLDDRDPWAHLTHGIVLFRMRRHREAGERGSPEHALRLSPNDPLVGAQAPYTMAIAHFTAGRYLDCVASARETIERYPEYLPGHYLFITAAAMKGETETATEALATLLRLRPDFSLAWVTETTPLVDKLLERVLEGLRMAGAREA